MTFNEKTNDFSLLKIVPDILRARGYRLYTNKAPDRNNGRLIDLWLNGGGAILGHTPANVLREMKNTASRGLFAPLPHFTTERYIKALSKIFQGYSFRLFIAPPPQMIALFKIGTVVLWRPFVNRKQPFLVDDAQSDNESKFFIPVLPGIHGWRDGLPVGLCIVAAKFENHFNGLSPEHTLPPNDIFPPVHLSAALRGLHDLLASPQRGQPALPQTNKTLHNSKIWQRQNIYLKLKEVPSSEKWESLFKQFLEAGFLLPPNPFHPVILPGELSKGEDEKLAELLGSSSL